MDYNRTGDFLKSLRKAKGLTQQAVADELYVNSKTISKWENGDSIPDFSIIENVADFYGVTVDEILKGRRINNKDEDEINTKNNKDEKIIANTIKRKYTVYFYIALGIMGLLFTISMIIYAVGNNLISLVIYLFGLLVSMFIMILGNQVCHQEIDDYDDELIIKGYNRAKKILDINNKLYVDVFFLLVVVFILLYIVSSDTSFLLSSFTNSTIFNLLVVIEYIIGFSMIIIYYILIRSFVFKKNQFNKLRNNILTLCIIISFMYILFGIRAYYIDNSFIGFENNIKIHNGLLFIIEYFNDEGLIFPLLQMIFIIGSVLSLIFKKIIPVLINLIIITISTVFTQTIDTGDYFRFSPICCVLVIVSVGCLCYLIYLEKKEKNTVEIN